MTIMEGPSPTPTNTWLVSGGLWKKSPELKQPLLALDNEHALAGEHEECLLIVVVVPRVELSGLEHAQVEAELREPGINNTNRTSRRTT